MGNLEESVAQERSEAVIHWGSVGALGVAIGWLSLRLPEGGGWIAVSVLLVLIALMMRIGSRSASDGRLLPELLVVSFMFTGLRRDVGFIVLEPWELVTILCFASWAFEAIRQRQVPVYLDKVCWCGLLVLAGTWLSYFGALDAETWFKRAVRIFLLFTVYMYLVSHVQTRRSFQLFLRAILFGCALSSIILVWQLVDSLAHSGGLDTMHLNLYGAFINSNEGATYTAMFAVLLLTLRLFRVDQDVMSGWASSLVLWLTVLAILLGRSRTGTFALLAVAATVFVTYRTGGRIGRLGLVAVLAAMAVAVILNFEGPRFFALRFLATFGASGDATYDMFLWASVVERMYMTKVYWAAMETSPIFGMGAANWGSMDQLALNLGPPPEGYSWGISDANNYLGLSSHNGYVSWLAETGLVGFLPFLGSLLITVVALRRLLRRPDASPWWRAVAMGMLGAVTVFIITNLTGDFLVAEARYWLLLALTTITLRLSREPVESWLELPTSPIRAASVARITT